MQTACPEPVYTVEDGEFVRALLEECLANGELVVPVLPQVAVRVVRIGTKESTNAGQLSDIIDADRALRAVVLRIAGSAANRPVMPIVSLRHAVAWLGINEVANIAFTLALQGRMLDVPGQQPTARRLWRHALASALWSRQLAIMLGQETGPIYLCGLLHDIGKVVALGAINDLARRAARALTPQDYDRLIAMFHRDVGARVVAAWQLPPPVPAVTAHWEAYAGAGAARFDSNVVNVAHRLADYTLFSPTPRARDELVTDPAYRDLGLNLDHGNPLFDSAAAINAELDRYLAP